ncbi:hypothetical protein [Streptomyces sp. NBC_01483]|uniref:hypothetical protein n=1 Tax=Streptomyces sp. NBC_01483 TaxID=2903883 RepID=UPI002E360F8D|nr:hypothetical protein [Streptomyces sp. NBC_01483]
MAAIPGTHVHTADNAVPPLNDDLAGLLNGLAGFHPGLDLIADGVRALALDRLTIPQTQAVVTMLAGSTDQPGTQIDASALIAALVARLLNADENPALRTLPVDVQDQARTAGADFTDHDAYVTPRGDIAKTVYDLNPI